MHYQDVLFYSWKGLKNILSNLKDATDVYYDNVLNILQFMSPPQKPDDNQVTLISNGKFKNYFKPMDSFTGWSYFINQIQNKKIAVKSAHHFSVQCLNLL